MQTATPLSQRAAHGYLRRYLERDTCPTALARRASWRDHLCQAEMLPARQDCTLQGPQPSLQRSAFLGEKAVGELFTQPFGSFNYFAGFVMLTRINKHTRGKTGPLSICTAKAAASVRRKAAPQKQNKRGLGFTIKQRVLLPGRRLLPYMSGHLWGICRTHVAGRNAFSKPKVLTELAFTQVYFTRSLQGNKCRE